MLEEKYESEICAKIAAHDEKVISSGESMMFFEDTWRGKNGIDAHHLVSKVPLRGPSGAVDSVLTVAMDITPMKLAEKRAETALAELKKINILLQAVLDTVPALINVKDAERRYILVNRAHVKTWGAAEADMLGKRFEDCVIPRMAPKWRRPK